MRTTVYGPAKDGWRIDKLVFYNLRGNKIIRYEVLHSEKPTSYRLTFVSAKRTLSRVRQNQGEKQ